MAIIGHVVRSTTPPGFDKQSISVKESALVRVPKTTFARPRINTDRSLHASSLHSTKHCASFSQETSAFFPEVRPIKITVEEPVFVLTDAPINELAPEATTSRTL